VTTAAVVVGAGITGLVAARDLAIAGAQVTVVDPAPAGGKLRASRFDGGHLDEAADGFLARVPEGVELCTELGLEGDLVSPALRRAHVYSHGALRMLPEGQVMGVPVDLDEVAASGIVSPAGIERARQDLRQPLTAPTDDVTIGAFIRGRLGDEVHERLVDPLVGGINAGDTDRLSLAATVPQLDAAARSGASSLMEACRVQRAAVPDPSRPVFYAPRGGMTAIIAALVADLERRGVELVTGTVDAITQDGARWQVALGDGRGPAADTVVLTAPAWVTAALVAPHAPHAAELLAAVPYASVAMISLAVDRAAIDRPLDGTGFLVPRPEGRTVTACSWTSAKWPHLAGDGTVWLRTSVGRDGSDAALALPDDRLVQAAVSDLRDTMALRADPLEARVTRWTASLPQYRPGHLQRMAAVDADLDERCPTLVVAGAALRGLGVPACIRQGRAAAGRAAAALDPTS
jgi:oxygen-dependent protoporphyrinogen oxidase